MNLKSNMETLKTEIIDRPPLLISNTKISQLQEEIGERIKINKLFKENSILAKIWTQQQYEEYLKNIFPETLFKKILFHNSTSEFKDEWFKETYPNFNTLNSLPGIYNFSTNQDFTERYGDKKYYVILDIKNPHIEDNSGEYISDMDSPLSHFLFKTWRQLDKNPFAPKNQNKLKKKDAFINKIKGELYIKSHPVSGKEMWIPKQELVTVFNQKQIHILWSKIDADNFSLFIK